MSLGAIIRECVPLRGLAPVVKEELAALKSGRWKMSSLLNMQETSEPDAVEVPQLLLSECWISGS